MYSLLPLDGELVRRSRLCTPTALKITAARRMTASKSTGRRGPYVAPSYLRWLYKTPGYVHTAADQNVLAAWANCGGNEPNNPAEVNLNTQYAEAIANLTPDIYSVSTEWGESLALRLAPLRARQGERPADDETMKIGWKDVNATLVSIRLSCVTVMFR
ncbi:hypothetical protein EDB86DRAFT_2836229 [Lactarius hatsudake]|nr:hypothetical protein EDB86DRAFT_2836229 [Lactarius hatsudake]